MAKFKSRAYVSTASLATPSWGTCPVAKEWIIIGLRGTNTDGASAHPVTTQIIKDAGNGGGTVKIIPGYSVGALDAIDISGRGTRHVLEANDQVQFGSDGTFIHFLMSFYEKAAGA